MFKGDFSMRLNNPFVLRLWVAWVSVLAYPCFAADPDYAIKIHRPDKAGMKFDVAITSALKREMTTSINGRETPAQEEVLAVELKATAEIVEVDEAGRDLKVTYVVEKCVKSSGDKDEEILPRGKIFTAAVGPDKKKTIFTTPDGKLTDDQSEALDLVADLPAPDAALPDELYGPKSRQKIGSSWSVNSSAMAEDLKRHDYQVKPDDISGSVKINGLEKANNVECLNITGDMKVAKAKVKLENDPNNAAITMKNATIDSNFSWLLPIDPALNHVVAFGTVTSNYSMGGQTPDGGEIKRELKTTRMYEIRAIPIN